MNNMDEENSGRWMKNKMTMDLCRGIIKYFTCLFGCYEKYLKPLENKNSYPVDKYKWYLSGMKVIIYEHNIHNAISHQPCTSWMFKVVPPTISLSLQVTNPRRRH